MPHEATRSQSSAAGSSGVVGAASDPPIERIPVGVSSCLLGEAVRYDGGHKHNRYLTEALSRYFEFVPYCPEALAGLGTPRPPIRLIGDAKDPQAVRIGGDEGDVTEALKEVARTIAPAAKRLCGYIFKRGSPSCGMERIKVYPARISPDRGSPSAAAKGSPPIPRTGQGIVARAIMEAWPLLPCEDEGRLNDPALCESFIERVFTRSRWLRTMAKGASAGKLVDFHTRHKLLLLSHSEVHYRAAGRLVAQAGEREIEGIAEDYIGLLMEGMRRRATRRRHTNVLQHLAGYLKRSIDEADRRELIDLIEEYRIGSVSLTLPIRFLRHHLRKAPNRHAEMQHYLEPWPDSLGLRNHL
ncbi:MAG: DUF1722 domain-containing protein [Ectothiorhodospiraceae bacterium AqS1]|nr:DUF1722 domain-containing protein [Ectothiorhodospiraceae bacterium AqS1]